MNEMKNNQSVVPENGMQSFREVATEKYLCPGEVTFREKDGFLTLRRTGKRIRGCFCAGRFRLNSRTNISR